MLSEKAAWEFAGENQLDLVTVLPSFIVGPSLPRQPCKTVSDVVGLLKGGGDLLKSQSAGHLHPR